MIPLTADTLVFIFPFRILNKVPVADVAVMALVTGLTVAFDLAVAVLCRVIVSALVFAWETRCAFVSPPSRRRR